MRFTFYTFFIILFIKIIIQKKVKKLLKIYLITISYLNLFILSKEFSRIYLMTISHLNLFILIKRLFLM